MPCRWCKEEHHSYPTVKAALDILQIKEYRVACKRAARGWLESLLEALLRGMPSVEDTAVMYAAASWLLASRPQHADALAAIAEKADKARKKG